MNLTNITDLPLDLAVWLASDDYDYVPDTISTTTLLKPVRQIILAKRADKIQRNVDITDLVASRMGTALHDSIEKAWNGDYKKALRKLGYAESELDLIAINPEINDPDKYNIYMEQRFHHEFMGRTITGKFDLVLNGQLKDHKSTGVYTYIKKSNIDKFVLQGSIYRWGRQDIIRNSTVVINYIFTDWSKLDSIKNKNYPQSRLITETYPLLSLDDTEKYLADKINLLNLYADTPEPDLPPCTREDLWQDDDVYRYYADASKAGKIGTRCTKVFTTSVEAYAYAAQQQKGAVIVSSGKVKACNYCAAYNLCTQKDAFLASGALVPKT